MKPKMKTMMEKEKEKSEEVDEEDCQGGRVLRKLRLPTSKPFRPIWLVWLEASTVTEGHTGENIIVLFHIASHFISSSLIIHVRTVLCSTAQERVSLYI